MSTDINPFIGVSLFRTDEDQKRLDREKTDLANSKLKVTFTFHHGWYSQSTADRDGSFEEWENMDGATVSVTHVTETTIKGKPSIDARYVGTLAKKIRVISLDGEEISNKKTMVLLGTSRMAVHGATTVRDAIGKSGIWLQGEHTLRVEQDGETVYDGSYKSGLDIPLEGNCSYTVILKPIEKPVVQQVATPTIQKTHVLITYSGIPSEVRINSTLGMYLRAMKLTGTNWMFNGVKIDSINDFLLTQDGTVRKITVEAEETVSAPPAIPKPPTSSHAYVDSKLGGITFANKNAFTPIKDMEGNLCHSQGEIDTSIKNYYRANRDARFAWGLVVESSNDFQVRAARRFAMGSAIVGIRIGTTWLPVCLKTDWDRVLGVELARW